MSVDPSSVVEWIGQASPAIFVASTIVGVVGSLLSRWYFRRGARSQLVAMEIDQLIAELNRQTDTSSDEVRKLHRQIVEQILEMQKKEARSSLALTKLGEYLSNHSPADSLTRGVGQ